MRQAISKSNALQVPLIVAGDLHDTKANLRGECVNAMIETFKLVQTQAYILVGNHDKINEKSENHSLNFLTSFASIIDRPTNIPGVAMTIPYCHDLNTIKLELEQECAAGPDILIMHQGITGSNSGEYIQDKTAITVNDVAGLRVISGHYHQRQDIVLPDGGLWSYIGNPYTQNFAEANDPEKGYQILFDDGSLEFVPTNLRKHIIYTNKLTVPRHTAEDLIWFKLSGTKAELATTNKEFIAKLYKITQPFKLDLIATDVMPQAIKKQNQTQPELLDSIIDSLAIDDDRKNAIKDIWKTKV